MKHFRGWKELSPIDIERILARQPRNRSTVTSMKPEQKITHADITKGIQNLLTTLAIFHYKHWQGPFSTPGISDIVGCLNGRAFWIEVKTPKDKVTPAQQRFLDNARDAGALAFVARSVEDVIAGLSLYDRVLL